MHQHPKPKMQRQETQKRQRKHTKKYRPSQQAGGGLLSWARDKWRTSKFGMQSTADRLRSEIPAKLGSGPGLNIVYIDKANIGGSFTQETMKPLTRQDLLSINSSLTHLLGNTINATNTNPQTRPQQQTRKGISRLFKFSSKGSKQPANANTTYHNPPISEVINDSKPDETIVTSIVKRLKISSQI